MVTKKFQKKNLKILIKYVVFLEIKVEQKKNWFIDKNKVTIVSYKEIQIISFLCIYNHSNNSTEIIIGEPGEISTETFLGGSLIQKRSINCLSFIKTKFLEHCYLLIGYKKSI